MSITFLPLRLEIRTSGPWYEGRAKSGIGCSRRAGLSCCSWATAGVVARKNEKSRKEVRKINPAGVLFIAKLLCWIKNYYMSGRICISRK
jgi:hypothetical protein